VCLRMRGNDTWLGRYSHDAKSNMRGQETWYGEELDQTMEVWKEEVWTEKHNDFGEFVLDKDALWVQSGYFLGRVVYQLFACRRCLGWEWFTASLVVVGDTPDPGK
jgi:hypothetical protein